MKYKVYWLCAVISCLLAASNVPSSNYGFLSKPSGQILSQFL